MADLIETQGCLTRAELESVLDDANEDTPIHVVMSMATGETRPVRAAMASGESDHVFLYIEEID